jgi:hypothetical protein
MSDPETGGKWDAIQTPSLQHPYPDSGPSRIDASELPRLSRSPAHSGFSGYVVDLPGFFTNWTNFLWFAFYVTVLVLARLVHLTPVETEHSAFIPQYAPWYSYQVGIKIPSAPGTSSRYRISVTIVSKSTSPLIISGNTTVDNVNSQFQISAANEPFPLFVSPARTSAGLDLKVDFNPGLSPSDHLLFRVFTDGSVISLIGRWMYSGFAVAIAVQFGLFCFRFSASCQIDRVQIGTALFMLLRVWADVSLVCPEKFFSLGYVVPWFEFCYCAFIFAALVPNTFVVVCSVYAVLTLSLFVMPFVERMIVMPVQVVLLAGVMAYAMFFVNVAYFMRVLGYLIAVVLFCIPRWGMQVLFPDSHTPFALVMRAVLENGFVLTMGILHQRVVKQAGYEKPDEAGSDLGVEKDEHAGEDEALDISGAAEGDEQADVQ